MSNVRRRLQLVWLAVLDALGKAASALRRGRIALMAERRLWRAVRIAPRVARWALLAAVIAYVVSTSQLPVAAAASWIAGAAGLTLAASVAVWLVARTTLWWRLGRARWGIFAPAARRQRMSGIYRDSLDQTRENGIALIRVVRVYQVARRGSKCVVEHPWGARQDAWFWWRRPRRGQVLLVRCGVNYGPHNRINAVMYIGSEMVGHGILGRLPAAAWRIGRKAHGRGQ
jgi:hypothetical protein